MKILFCFALAAALAAQQPAQKKKGPPPEAADSERGYTDTPQLPGQPWKVHDAARPRPPKVTPGMPLLNEAPPADAIVLFNGKDLSQWTSDKGGEAKWKVVGG